VNRRRRSNRVGFSLVELIAVVVILGMLAGIVALNTRGYLNTSKQNTAKVEMAKLIDALETFYTLNDRYPTSDEGLEILKQGNEKMPGGIIQKVPTDPWNNAYQYVQPGADAPYDLLCLGADGKEGGTGYEADLTQASLE